jgi:gliding motility-associated-like protein
MRVLLILFFLLISSAFYAQNDDCVGAISVTPTFTNCSYQAGTSANTTQSFPSCSGGGIADDDVWFSFVANSSSTTITVDPTSGYDAVIELYSGTCGTLSSIQCEDANGQNGDEVLLNTGLTPGNTYFFRVFHYGIGSGTSTFNFCVIGLAPSTNNTACNAFPLPTVEPSCKFNTYTNLGSAGSSVPSPSGCGGSSPFQGGYAGGDVWFSVVVPASGELDIHTLSIDFADGAMALYSGTCASPVLVACDDDSGVGIMPYIYSTGLTPGATMFIRVWEYNNDANGQFGICVSTPDNDDCATAQQICDLNGYGGITSSAYTIDFPSNMTGTGQNGIANSNPTAPFGQSYTGISPVQIDNNSWLKFTASATTATLFVQVNSCSNGNGMQMQIFSGTNCTNFAAVSPFLETTNSQSITASGLTPGNDYYIMIDGFAGDICSYTITATSGVQVVQASAIKPALCLGESTILNALVAGPGPFVYSWSSTPAGVTGSTASINVTPTQNTYYSVDVTGQCGSITTANVFVTVNPLPVANVPLNDTICLNETLALNANSSGGVTPYSHLWTGTGQPFLNNSTSSSTIFTPSNSGNFTFIYEVSDPIGCSDKDSMSVFVNTIPNVGLTGNTTICTGDTAVLTATGGGSYLWSTGGALDSIVVSPSNNTNYTVAVTDANNCIDSASLSIQVNPLPTALILGSTLICQGSSTTLVASGGTSFLWSNGSTTPTITVSPLADSTYSVTVSNNSGCSDTTSIFVQVTNNPTAQIAGNDTICFGENTILTATGGGTYLWNNGLTSPVINMSPIADTNYAVIVDVGGCIDSTSYNVIVNPLPNVVITGNTVICEGELTTLFGTGGGDYSWSNGVVIDSIIVSPNTTTNYTLIITSTNSCVDSVTTSVQVNPLPVINIAGIVSICDGETTTLTASGAASYVWNTSAITPSITVTPTLTTNYTVLGTNSNGCKDSIQTTVTVLPQPVAAITGSNTICFGESVVLTATGGGSYTWNTLDTTASITMNPTDTTTYSVLVNVGGCIDSSTYVVDVTPLPTILAFSDTTIILGQSANIFAQGSGIYTWSPTDGLSCSNCASPTAKPSETTTYCVSTTENNCDNTSCVTVFVDNICGELYVPNAFSPNGDGSNDCLKVYNNCLEKVLFRIYSRWGELIYESEDIDGCWDGTHNGKDLNTGVYTFTVAAKLINGEEVEIKGNTTLFK